MRREAEQPNIADTRDYDFDKKSESVSFDDSDSEDDGMVAYWLQDAKMAAKSQKHVDEQKKAESKLPKVVKVVESTQVDNEFSVSSKVEQGNSSIQMKEKENYTHLLYIPFHTSNKFFKRCETFASQIITSNPGFEPYLTVDQCKIDVLPLNLSEFQVDLLQQLMEYGGIFEPNVECKAVSNKAVSYGKLKVELRGVEVYKIVDAETLNQSSSNWFKEAHRGPVYSNHIRDTKYQMSVVKTAGWKQVEEVINNAIGKLIELGIANDGSLKGARFDISQMKYKLEDPRVNIMEFEDSVDMGELLKIKNKSETFNFQHAEIDQMVFAEINQKSGALNTISIAMIK